MIILMALAIIAQAQPSQGKIVDPQSYAVKRFNEVIAAALAAEPKTLQEKLIAERAHLTIVQQDIATMEEKKLIQAPSDPPKDSEKAETFNSLMLRAAHARADHYEKQIATLEKQVLKDVQKERKREAKRVRRR